MTSSVRCAVFAGCAASVLGAFSAPAQTADSSAQRRARMEFLERYSQPVPLTRPSAALTEPHASAPEKPSPMSPGAETAAALTTAAATSAPAAAAPGDTTAVYFSAHPDDFLLFSLPYRDVAAEARMVYIFVTAGDGGLGITGGAKSYLIARENAAIKSIRFMADAARPWPERIYSTTAIVNGRPILKYSYRSSVAYFLRLPDGNGDGGGFPGTGNTSIFKLYKGSVSALAAVDDTATYKSWSELVGTAAAIVRTEAAGTPTIWLNANDPNASRNPDDHLDHYATGALSQGVQKALPCANAAYYVGYAIAGASNLTKEDALNKTGSFASYATGLNEKGYFSAWDGAHKAWLGGLSVRKVLGNGAACAY